MKKLFIILAIVVLGIASYGQKVIAFTTDTITNTETVVTFETARISPTTDVVVVILATNLTGTTAGTAVFQGSIDGTIFSTISTAAGDTMTITDGATYTWNTEELAGNGYNFYRVQFLSTGTHTTGMSGSYMFFKP